MTKSNSASNFLQSKVQINIFERVLTRNDTKIEKIKIQKSEFYSFLSS